ncbi:MAG: selenoneine biosynthesis selenosugar synthase SenB [Acidiferrobacterales bacterium]
MRILMITPAPRGSRSGNRTTAIRWARMLVAQGHHVSVTVAYDGAPADALIALHAWRSAEAVQRFRELYTDRPVIVALTGTDLYRFLHSDPEITRRSMNLADKLVVLHEAAADAVPESQRHKVRVILQSAQPPARKLLPLSRAFEICVIGHLRDEKDPLRAAYAVRELPSQSRLRVLHLGKAHTEAWAHAAREEMAVNPRYRWRGEVPFWRARQILARSRLMVLSSRMEGGANVISEAIVAGVPVIASRIDGSVGLLGPDYAGYYTTADTAALTDMLLRAENDPAFYASLESACAVRAPLFRPECEQQAWRELLAALP